MEGIICAPGKEIEAALKERRFDYTQIGILDSAGIRNAMIEATRLNLSSLIIDISALPGADNALLEGIVSFRIKRPNTRIIIIAPGKKPGDPLMASLFSKGIYDLIAPDENVEETKEAIICAISSSPGTFADGARWLGDYEISPTKTTGPGQAIKREIIVQDRAIGMNTIAISGVGSGAGCSYMSIAIARQIARAKKRVVVAEWPGASPGSQYSFLANGSKDIVSYQGVDFLLLARNLRGIDYVFTWCRQNPYDYLILDLGELTQEKVWEMDRAALAVLMVSSGPWRHKKFLDIINSECALTVSNIGTWTTVLTLTSDAKAFEKIAGKILGRVYPLPYCEDPTSRENEEIIQNILEPVLPSPVATKRKGLASLFKRAPGHNMGGMDND